MSKEFKSIDELVYIMRLKGVLIDDEVNTKYLIDK